MADYDVMILGAGSVGCVIGGYLAKQGARILLVNRRSDTMQAVAAHGLRLETETGLIHSTPDGCLAPDAGSASFIMCFTKTPDTQQAVTSVLPVISKDTIMVSMQNGLGNGQQLAELTGCDVVHGVTLIPATTVAPAYIRSHGAKTSWLGPLAPDNERQIMAARQLSEMLDKAGIETEYHADVLPAIWQKACFNVAMNGISALADASPGLIGDTPALHEQAHALAEEALQIASALKIKLDAEKVHHMIDFACSEHRYHQPSMLQDIRANRNTEINALNGYIVRTAEGLGINVPLNRMIYALVLARQNAPHFWATQPASH